MDDTTRTALHQLIGGPPMIYLLRPIGPAQFDTATAEEETTAERLEARGYTRCTLEEYRAQRRENDIRDQDRVLRDAPTLPAPDVPPGTAIGKTKDGLTIYKGDK